MDRHAEAAEHSRGTLGGWRIQDIEELEWERQYLKEERRKLEEEKRSLERSKREFVFKQELESKRIDQQKKMLDMKWKILEAELRKLAGEKEQVEQEKRFYENERRRLEGKRESQPVPIQAGIFFKGVGNELALKKRYKDLLKIYHPDNLDGDTFTLQEINREYEQLKQVMIS